MKYVASMSKTYYGSYIVEADSDEEARELVYSTLVDKIDSETDWDEAYDMDLNCGGVQEYQEPNKDLWT